MIPAGALTKRFIAACLSGSLPLLTAFGTADASPYKITGLDAADAWEVKLISKQAHEGDEHLLETPVLDFTAPLAPGLETSLTFGRGRLHADAEPARWGWLDTELALKWEIVPLREDGSIAFTTEPAIIAPTGSHGLSDDEWQVEVPLVIGWNRGPLRLRGLVGYGHSLQSEDDEISWGGLVEYKFTERFSLGAEVVNDMPSNDTGSWKSFGDLGFKFELLHDVELQGRIGRTLHTAGDDPRATEGALYLEIGL